MAVLKMPKTSVFGIGQIPKYHCLESAVCQRLSSKVFGTLRCNGPVTSAKWYPSFIRDLAPGLSLGAETKQGWKVNGAFRTAQALPFGFCMSQPGPYSL